MPPKKKKNTKNTKTGALPEIDKAFYELEIVDLNRKLSRLRTENEELRNENNEFRTFAKSVENDRVDVIEHIKRMNSQLGEEINDLKNELETMNKEKEETAILHKKKIDEMNQEYKMMREALLAESSLLTGKLNSLDQFRIHRDELMKKFSLMEKQSEARMKAHNRLIYEMERKYVAGKNVLKREMEVKLMQLSNDFNDSAEMCIANTTRRVIRENIAVNNELNEIMSTMNKLDSDNKDFKEKIPQLNIQVKLLEEEKNKLFRKYNMQNRILKKMTFQHTMLREQLNALKMREKEAAAVRDELKQTTAILCTYKLKVQLLKQKLQATQSETLYESLILNELKYKKTRILQITKHAKKCIDEILNVLSKSEETISVDNVKLYFQNINCLLDHAKMVDEKRTISMETLQSLDRGVMTQTVKCNELTVLMETESLEVVTEPKEREGKKQLEQKRKITVVMNEEVKSYKSSISSTTSDVLSSHAEESEDNTLKSSSQLSDIFAKPVDSASDSSISDETEISKEEVIDIRKSLLTGDYSLFPQFAEPDDYDSQEGIEEEEESIEEKFIDIDDARTETVSEIEITENEGKVE